MNNIQRITLILALIFLNLTLVMNTTPAYACSPGPGGEDDPRDPGPQHFLKALFFYPTCCGCPIECCCEGSVMADTCQAGGNTGCGTEHCSEEYETALTGKCGNTAAGNQFQSAICKKFVGGNGTTESHACPDGADNPDCW